MVFGEPYEKPLTHLEYTLAEEKPVIVTLASNKRDFIEGIKQQAFHCMRQVDGWCSDMKAAALIELILKSKPNVVVEIGVWGGKSLLPMACAVKANKKGIVYGIDPWDNLASLEELIEEANKAYWGNVDHDGVYRQLIQVIDAYDLDERVILIKSTSEDAPEIPGIDVLHIDGNHSKKTSYLDVTKWVPLMNSGGWIIFDDMTWYEKGIFTTAAAVDWLDEHCTKIAEFHDYSCIWGIWVKP